MTIATRDNRLLSFLSLFTSLGTLFCCALPSLLVLLGLGATVASFLSSAPWLVSLSRHKLWVFALSGLLIVGNSYYVYHLAPRLQARALACPIDDPRCRRASRFSRVVLAMSAGIWLVGFFTAFVLGPVLTRLDS
jgi:hypothetical protein